MGSYSEEAIKVLESTNVVKKEIKRKHPFRNFLIFVCISGIVIYIMSTSFFDIKTIRVKGNRYYSEKQVITLSDAKTGVNIFWGAGDSKIRNRLEKDPYFEDVSIRRKLPSTLVLKVEERKQIAAVEYGDKYVVIDPKGVVLRTGKIDPKLTLISGLKIREMKKGQVLKVKQSKSFEKTLKMLKAMEKGDIFFKKITFEEGQNANIRAYILDNLVVRGKPEYVMKRLNSGDLQKVVNNLVQKGNARGTIYIDKNNFITFSPDI